MNIDIPKLNKFLQANRGDLVGSIWSSFGLDFESNKNKLQVSQRGLRESDGSDLTNFNAPVSAFAYYEFDDKYYAVASDGVFRTTTSDDPTSAWEEFTSINNDGYGVGSDMVVFTNSGGDLCLYLRGDQRLVEWNGATTTETTVASGYSSRSTMCVYNNRVYYTTDDTKIYSMQPDKTLSTSGDYSFDVVTATGVDQQIVKILPVSNGIWICTIFPNRDGGEMLFWNGVDESDPTYRYKMEEGILSGVIKDDRPYVMDSFGRLLAHNNSTFVEVARMPVNGRRMYNYKASSDTRWIQKNGMMVSDNNEILINVANALTDTSADPIENLQGGIWSYNEDIGLYHKYAFSKYDVTGASITDMGQVDCSIAGAIIKAEAKNFSSDSIRSDFISSSRYYTNSSSFTQAFFINDYDDDIQKSGYLVTTQIQAEEILEQWQKVFIAHKKFTNADDKMVIKYRKQKDTPYYTDITWVNTTSFTSTDSDWATIKTNYDAGQDYEVEIQRGDGAGMCSHITDISEAGGTYTVTVDETHTGATTNTARVRIQSWTKAGEITGTTSTYAEIPVGEDPSTWIQFKVWIIGTGELELERLISVSEKHTPYSA